MAHDRMRHVFLSHKLSQIKKRSIMLFSKVSQKSISQLSQKSIDMMILSIAYLSCMLSVISIAYFAISIIACSLLAMRLHGMDIYNETINILFTHDRTSFVSCSISNVTCFMLCLSIAMSITWIGMLSLSQIANMACFILGSVSALMLFTDNKE